MGGGGGGGGGGGHTYRPTEFLLWSNSHAYKTEGFSNGQFPSTSQWSRLTFPLLPANSLGKDGVRNDGKRVRQWDHLLCGLCPFSARVQLDMSRCVCIMWIRNVIGPDRYVIHRQHLRITAVGFRWQMACRGMQAALGPELSWAECGSHPTSSTHVGGLWLGVNGPSDTMRWTLRRRSRQVVGKGD